MNQYHTNLLHLKRAILCQGIRLDPIKDDILTINPYFFEKSFSHSSSILLDKKILVNVPLLDRYANKSPYLITKDDNDFIIVKDGTKICEVNILNAPKWYEEQIAPGIKAADVIREHDINVLSCNPFRDCVYFCSEKKCRFCSYGTINDRELINSRNVDLYVKAISLAFSYNPKYELNISIGTWPAPDRGAVKIMDLIAKLRNNIDPRYISLEMAPPTEKRWIKNLKEVGISSIMFNIELYDSKIREKLCPGKSTIGLKQYFKAWKEAINYFGKWRVGSVLIVGIESLDSTIKGIDMLIGLGVLPIIMPFKPLDESMLSDANICVPSALEDVHTYLRERITQNVEIQKVLKERGLGCLSCPGCSV